jgi:hypothetical protein
MGSSISQSLSGSWGFSSFLFPGEHIFTSEVIDGFLVAGPRADLLTPDVEKPSPFGEDEPGSL